MLANEGSLLANERKNRRMVEDLDGPGVEEDAFLRRIIEKRIVLRDFSATCEAIVSRPLAEEL